MAGRRCGRGPGWGQLGAARYFWTVRLLMPRWRDRAEAQPLAVQRVDLGVAGLPPRAAPLALPRGPRRRRRLGWAGRRGAASGIGGGRRRRGGQGHRGQAHLAERGVVSCQQALEHVAQVGEQVPAIGHLDRARRALARTVGIGPAAIAADNLGTGVRFQPRFQARGGAIREQVDRAMRLQVDEDRAVSAPFLQAPVVHAEYARRLDRRERRLGHRPAQGVAAHRDPQVGQQARAGRAAHGDAEDEDDDGEARRPLGVGRGDRRQPLGEDAPRAARIVAEPAARTEAEAHRQPLPGHVGKPAGVPTVDPDGGVVADRAAGGRAARAQDERDPRIIGDDLLQRHDGRVGDERGGAHGDSPPASGGSGRADCRTTPRVAARRPEAGRPPLTKPADEP